MPRTIQGSPYSKTIEGIADGNYNYDYPHGLDLRPDSPVHNRIRDEVMKRARESNTYLSRRFDSWNKIDQTLTCYMEVDNDEESVQDADPRKPISIVFPYSYTVMETILSYLVAAFLQSPIFRYEGVSPEDTIGAIMLEKVVDVHCNRFNVGLALHTMLRDAIAYGIGPVTPSWKVQTGYRNFVTQNPFGGFGMETKEVTLFEGNCLNNIDPYLYLPDPNVSVHAIQDGEYVGWIEKTNLMNLLSAERESLGTVFNARYVKHLNGKCSTLTTDHSDRQTKFGGPPDRFTESSHPVDVIYMYIKIVPSDWGLTERDYPEKWLFAIANDEIVLEARPANFNHNMFPIGVASPDFDGYSPLPLSRMELFYGLQHTLDFLFNSHVANVRKAVNDMLVIDPYIINAPDVENPKPGKIIRTRRPGWGKGIRDAIMQLQVNDVTRQNIQDSTYLMEMMNKVGATDDSAMGNLRSGGPERLTKGEYQGTRMAQGTRLDRVTRAISMQALQAIGYMFGVHAQQMMSMDLYVTTTGRWQETLMKDYQVLDPRMKVTPYDIQIDYDVFVRDGSVPGGNFSDSWLQLWQTISTNPMLTQVFDIVRVFKHIARNLGAKDVDDFINVNYKIMSDQQVMRNVQAGNMIPVNPAQTEGAVNAPIGQ